MEKPKIKIVRDHIEIDFDDTVFRIEIDKFSKSGIIVNKQYYGNDGSEVISIKPKVSNKITIE